MLNFSFVFLLYNRNGGKFFPPAVVQRAYALDPHRIFQRTVAGDTHADIIEALFPGRYSGVIMSPFQKFRIRPDIVLILPDKLIPVSGKLPVIANPSFIDHIIVRERFRRDSSDA